MVYTEETFQAQRDWSERALMLMRETLPLMAPVARHGAWEGHEQTTLAMLLSAAARSTESTLLLCAYGQLWDAEVTLRSVCEASLKFAFIMQTKEQFKTRIGEYGGDHFNATLLKDDQKVRDLLDALGDPDAKEWKPLRERLLTDEERTTLGERHDKAARRALETRWGFTGIIGALRRSNDQLFADFGGLAHGYSIASHVHHADYQGVSIPLDRDARQPDRRDSLHMAHLARLISDSFDYLLIRLGVGYRFIEHDTSSLREARLKVQGLRDSFGGAYNKWIDIEYPE